MKKVDLSNTIRPFALLEIANGLKRLRPGREMEIIGLDSSTIRDLKCILPVRTHTIHMEISGEDHGRMVVRIRKGR